MTPLAAALVVLAYAQGGAAEVGDADRAIILGGFAAGVVGIFLYIARDAIFRRKTSYDSEDLGSKRDRTYEKYHSDWGDEYEDIGSRTRDDGARRGGELPDYYSVLGVDRNAEPAEIKARFRELAKKEHPDRTGDEPDRMAEINEAYGVLSDARKRKRYDAQTDS